jgi:hypothetical protein
MERAAVLLLFVLAAALPGCAAALTAGGEAVRVSDENMVNQCQYFGDVTGSGVDVGSARNNARNYAARWGATNIVFVSETPRVSGISVKAANAPATAMGHAYRCREG